MSTLPGGAVPSLLLLAALHAAPATAAELPVQTTPAAQAEPAEPARRVGYVTESGRHLPDLQLRDYQGARRRWFAGFIVTMSGLGLVATGVTAFIFGSASGSPLGQSDRDNAMVAGGVFTGAGIAATAIGSVLWAWGRRDVLEMEHGLPMAGPVPVGLLPKTTLQAAPPPPQHSIAPLRRIDPLVSLGLDSRGGPSAYLGLTGKF